MFKNLKKLFKSPSFNTEECKFLCYSIGEFDKKNFESKYVTILMQDNGYFIMTIKVEYEDEHDQKTSFKIPKLLKGMCRKFQIVEGFKVKHKLEN